MVGNLSYQTWGGLTYGAYTIYGHDSSATTGNLAVYGYLYNWYAVKGIATAGSTTYKNICPTGWHVPTIFEWDTLSNRLGGNSVSGGKLKSTSSLWSSQSSGADNSSGFSAIPGGSRIHNGGFDIIRTYAVLWSATESDINYAWYRFLNYYSDVLYRESNLYPDNKKSLGASVRCLRD